MDPLVLRRSLGKTGIEVSLLTCGTWGLCTEAYGNTFPEQRARTLERAVARGLTTFDMAPVWGEEGEAERSVAAAVGERRSGCVYVTRAGQVQGEHGHTAAFEEESLRAQCEASLQRLATDHIDVWLLHNPVEGHLRQEGVLRTAENLVTEGKVRAWGASVSHVDTVRAALAAGAQVICVPYHVLAQETFDSVADDCAARGVGILVRSVLFHGLLSGAYTPGRRFPIPDHRTARFSHEALSERLKQIAALRPLTRPPALTFTALALRFAVQSPAVGSAIFGPRTPSQVDSAVDAFAGDGALLEDATLNALRVAGYA
jgi:aryl-alcohol dehydrogenase-like predicted oxidoreductase